MSKWRIFLMAQNHACWNNSLCWDMQLINKVCILYILLCVILKIIVDCDLIWIQKRNEISLWLSVDVIESVLLHACACIYESSQQLFANKTINSTIRNFANMLYYSIFSMQRENCNIQIYVSKCKISSIPKRQCQTELKDI